jgi:hypothetical protein
MKQELFYVSASRGLEDIAILTPDANGLGESLGASMARPSAIELANEIAHSKRVSISRQRRQSKCQHPSWKSVWAMDLNSACNGN